MSVTLCARGGILETSFAEQVVMTVDCDTHRVICFYAIMAVTAEVVFCRLCSFRTRTISEWISHLRLVHSEDDEFSVRCGINGCTREYRKCASFLTHVYRHHRDVVISSSTASSADVVNPSFEGMFSSPVPLHEHICDSSNTLHSAIDHTVHQLLGTDKIEQKKRSAVFIFWIV